MNIAASVRGYIRRYIRFVASFIDRTSNHLVTPNGITIVGAVAHIGIALLIAFSHPLWAAGLLVIFGLFDTLDGELARLQSRASPQGMLLDASTDRFKETFLYIGVAYNIAVTQNPRLVALAVAACGTSICVSYVKAKGEAAIAASGRKFQHAELNRLFSDGLATFEVRMVILLIGLLANQLVAALIIITVLASFTALQRLYRISHELR